MTLAALLRKQGLQPVLIERMTGLEHPGYMLALMPMVDQALEDIGVHDEYLARSAPARPICLPLASRQDAALRRPRSSARDPRRLPGNRARGAHRGADDERLPGGLRYNGRRIQPGRAPRGGVQHRRARLVRSGRRRRRHPFAHTRSARRRRRLDRRCRTGSEPLAETSAVRAAMCSLGTAASTSTARMSDTSSER
ncbi:hypothetical protein [Microbacterium sp. AK031]|uniref:hypothetical protein n=1 Tax=Microbacterium sp. AK031 TaxID=2723076 RepID=UPI002169EAF9|nr:hypothetical protein [Microbacterium sp. AK031]